MVLKAPGGQVHLLPGITISTFKGKDLAVVWEIERQLLDVGGFTYRHTHTYTHTCIPTAGRLPRHHGPSNHRRRQCPIVQTYGAPPDPPWGSLLPPALLAHLRNRSTGNPTVHSGFPASWIRQDDSRKEASEACQLTFHSQHDMKVCFYSCSWVSGVETRDGAKTLLLVGLRIFGYCRGFWGRGNGGFFPSFSNNLH